MDSTPKVNIQGASILSTTCRPPQLTDVKIVLLFYLKSSEPLKIPNICSGAQCKFPNRHLSTY